MAQGVIRPIDEHTARAIEESAKAVSNVVGAAEKGGSWVSKVLGELPTDVVGFYFGDRLHHKRLLRLIELEAETEEHHRRWGRKGPKEDLSPSLGIPLLEAASDETREGLKQLWSKLLAAAMHPERAKFVRASLIEAVKKMDPLDALILETLETHPRLEPNGEEGLAGMHSVSVEEVAVSIENLRRLGFLMQLPEPISSPGTYPHYEDLRDPKLADLATLLRRAVCG